MAFVEPIFYVNAGTISFYIKESRIFFVYNHVLFVVNLYYSMPFKIVLNTPLISLQLSDEIIYSSQIFYRMKSLILVTSCL